MSEAWYIAFGLVGAISLASALLLIAALRQIGVLYERIGGPPTEGEDVVAGLEPGRAVAVPQLEPVTSLAPEPFRGGISIIAYVQPRCAACKDLPGHLAAYMSDRESTAELEALLVTDADIDASDPYVASLVAESGLALYRSPSFGTLLGIPGSPFILAVDRATDDLVRVLASGTASKAEEVEKLIRQAVEFRVASDHPILDPASGPSALKLPLHSSEPDSIVTPTRRILAKREPAQQGMETR